MRHLGMDWLSLATELLEGGYVPKVTSGREEMGSMPLQASEAVIINRYFGKKPGETNVEFLTELKALSLEEKHYLAVEAAKELGLVQEDVLFPLA